MTNYPYFAMPRAKTVNHGLESLSYIGSKLWDSMPSHMKEIDSINEFKHVIEAWKPDLCWCRLCDVYLKTLEFAVSKMIIIQITQIIIIIINNNNNNNDNNDNTYMYTKIHMSRKIRIS